MNRLGFWASEVKRSLTIALLMLLMVATAMPAAVSRHVFVGSTPDFGLAVPYRLDADGFNYGVTRPVVDDNAGLTGAARQSYTGGTQVTGSTDPANPVVIRDRNISVLIEVMSGHVRFYNCFFDADVSSKPNALVTCLRAGILGVEIERCKFSPSVPSYTTDAVRGHHVKVRRCEITNVVDGLGSFNIYAARTDNEFIGNVTYDLCKFDEDGYNESPRRSGSHVDGTHNDMVQHQGGLGLVVLGNVCHGYNRYANGARPTDIGSLMTTQCVLIQANVAVGGVYYLDEIRVERNWVVEGYNQTFAFITRASGANTYEPSCKLNIWESDTTRYFAIRGSVQANINGHSGQAMGTAVTYPEDGNVYADLDTVSASKRGQLVPIRRDTSF